MPSWASYLWRELTGTYFRWSCNPKESNIIVAVIYRHLSMDVTDFNISYLNKLLENISEEQKSIFLFGDFNISLSNNQTNEFLDSLTSNLFLPLILCYYR